MVETLNDRVIETTNATVTVLESNILHFYYRNDLEVQDIIEVEEVYNSLVPQPKKVIQEMGPFVSMSSEARSYAAERSPDLTAVAYVIRSLAQRLLIKFYIRMWRRKKPAKVFENFDEALAWIRTM